MRRTPGEISEIDWISTASLSSSSNAAVRVQGLAFAQGRQPDAPGCGASRIDPRCKKSALEQRFGPFPLR